MNNTRYESLDFLRSISCLGIVLLHTHTIDCRINSENQFEDIYSIFTNFHSFVYLFFGLSGFLIFNSLQKLNKGKFKYSNYIKGRLSKILPLYYITVTIAYILINISGVFDLNIYQYFLSLIYSYTIVYGDMNPINPVFWSLETEVQFYLIAPILFTILSNNTKNCIILFITLIAIHYTFYQHLKAFNLERSILNYGSYFISGCIAFSYQKIKLDLRNLELVAIILLLFLLLLNFGYYNYIINNTCVTLLIIVCITKIKIFNYKYMNIINRNLADISYILYLTHYPVIYLIVISLNNLQINPDLYSYPLITFAAIMNSSVLLYLYNYALKK